MDHNNKWQAVTGAKNNNQEKGGTKMKSQQKRGIRQPERLFA